MAKRRNRSTMDLIRDLKQGRVRGSQLTPDRRRQCVEFLMLEDVSKHEIADLIGCCERTVRRDLAHIRRDNALLPSSDTHKEILGQYRMQIERSVSRLNKIVRDQSASPTDKITALTVAAEISDQYVGRLAGLGLLSGGESDAGDVAALAEVVKVAAVIAAELGEESPLAIEIRELIGRLRPGAGLNESQGE